MNLRLASITKNAVSGKETAQENKVAMGLLSKGSLTRPLPKGEEMSGAGGKSVSTFTWYRKMNFAVQSCRHAGLFRRSGFGEMYSV